MRKLISTLFLALVAFSFSAYSSNADLFEYDRQALSTEFAELNELEAYVLYHQDVNLDDLQSNPLIGAMDFNSMKTASPMGAMFTIDDMDWGSFLWGFLCCPVGFFVVAMSGDKSSDQKISFWIGVAVSAVLGSIGGGSQL
jgi:hypothetical protein